MKSNTLYNASIIKEAFHRNRPTKNHRKMWCPLSCGALGSCLLCLTYDPALHQTDYTNPFKMKKLLLKAI